MKFDGSDPPRIDEGEASELGRLVRASRHRRAPARTAERVAQGLTTAGAFATGTSSPSSSTGVFGRVGGAKLGALALAFMGLGGTMFAFQARTSDSTPPPVSAPATQMLAAAPPPPPSTADIPSMPVEALPSSATPAVVVTSTAARAGAPPSPASWAAPRAASSPPSREGEFAFIKRAQDALASDPSRALSIAEEHARTFPAGEFVQEREVVAVQALARLGRTTEAKSRANALLARFPRTPYVPRLERELREPLTSTIAR